MLKIISTLILRIYGWKIKGDIPSNIKKCVLIVAPHTSNSDFIVGRLVSFALKMKAKFLIKKELFKFPLGRILKICGGIPIDRSKSSRTVNDIVDIFKKHHSLVLIITPEGTRKYNPHWKRGFYHIALSANVPIVLGCLDYSIKEAEIGLVVTPTGNWDKDFKIIEDFYRGRKGKYPENFNLNEK